MRDEQCGKVTRKVYLGQLNDGNEQNAAGTRNSNEFASESPTFFSFGIRICSTVEVGFDVLPVNKTGVWKNNSKTNMKLKGMKMQCF